MSFRDSIDIELRKKKVTKKEIILNVKDDIQYMLDNNISIKRQVELILENKIVDKLSTSEFVKILISDFGYVKNSSKTKKVNKVEKIIPEEPREPKEKTTPTASAKDLLSMPIDLNS